MFKEVNTKQDFPQLEVGLLKTWYKKGGVVEKYLKRNLNKKENFSFIDGPITANNPMGVHHAWGRTYKDLWQRFFNMIGFRQRFQNGFDEQGLWVEVEVEKELGLHSKKDIENLVEGNPFESLVKFVNLCKERVKKFSDIQTEQSKRLGYFMDWDNSYHTSSDQNNYSIWHYLKTVNEKGWLYKGRDSVPWCPRCGTAISQHEILTEEYKEVVHKSVFFKLPIQKSSEKLLVWTTTPWTIPGNSSVAVNPKSIYQLVSFEDDKLWVMKDRVENVFGKKVKVLKSAKGKSLLGLKYKGAFDKFERIHQVKSEKFHTVIAAEDLVTSEEGTGLVHIAPGAGEEDFKLSKELSLPVIELIDEEANYLNNLGEFSGKNAKKHPELILDYLESFEDGSFFFRTENYKHRYPTCWRCKTELVWRVVDEWYIAMDKKDSENGKTYRESMREAIKSVNWKPSWGYERELDWLNNMHDWLISKKRYWGLALPIWECKSCNNFDVVGSKEDLKVKAVEGWEQFEGNSPHRPWVDQIKIRCTKCGQIAERIADVGNPWLDAGIVPFATLGYFESREKWEEWFPADFITESFPGQFKNWFYSLIAMSVALEGKAPFKTLLGHGSVKDEKGEEMHKSKGNAVWFDEAAKKMGVDVMRWLYLRNNPEANVNFGYHAADEVRRYFHLRLWNVYAFFTNYARLENWSPSEPATFEPKDVEDRWVLSRLSETISSVEKNLKEYNPATAVEQIEKFVVDDLSNWYVRRIRDRIGPTAESSTKNDAYQTLWFTLVEVSKLIAPLNPFIADEIFTNLTGQESVHLVEWPKTKYLIDDNLQSQMKSAIEISSLIHASRKEASIKVRQPLSSATYSGEKLSEEVEKLVLAEVNIKKLFFRKEQKEKVTLDIKISDELKKEGEAREVVRAIQEARKEAGCKLDEKIEVILPSWPKEFEDYIKKETLAVSLELGEKLLIKS